MQRITSEPGFYLWPQFSPDGSRLETLGVQPLFIEPGSPWENGYVESFNGKLRDELLDREIFYTLPEAATVMCAGVSSSSP